MPEENFFQRSLILSSPDPIKSPALFLDRDGVVIEDCHYLSDPDKVRLCLGARDLINQAYRKGIPVVLITNQSGIGRGLFKWDDFEKVNERMQDLLGSNSPLAAIYANGYGPDAPCDSWRKPSPEMLLQAAIDLNLDLQNSIIVGDRLTDLQAGASAGVAFAFHVLTGHGSDERNSVVGWHSLVNGKNEVSGYKNKQWLDLHLINSLVEFPVSLLKLVKEKGCCK